MTFRFTCEYNGKNFCGFQRQKNGISIQQVLEEAFSKYFGQDIGITASGRTDSGVHAKGQVCSFQRDAGPSNCRSIARSGEENPRYASHTMNNKGLFRVETAVNSWLPSEVCVRDLRIVDDSFNARFDVRAKTYVYRCFVSPHRSPLRDGTMLQLYKKPDLGQIELAAKYLVGTHDFTAFSSASSDKENRVRTIHSLEVVTFGRDGAGHLGGVNVEGGINEISFVIRGNGFLRNMVRIIVGTLLEVGEGRRMPDDVRVVLESRDRTLAGKTAPAHGLCLESVEYQG